MGMGGDGCTGVWVRVGECVDPPFTLVFLSRASSGKDKRAEGARAFAVYFRSFNLYKHVKCCNKNRVKPEPSNPIYTKKQQMPMRKRLNYNHKIVERGSVTQREEGEECWAVTKERVTTEDLEP